jgi:hypothetical protein
MSYPLDLYVLVADLDQQQALQALLGSRAESLGIRGVRFEVTKHPQRDGGCFTGAPALLQTLQSQAAHAIVVLDREGCGAEDKSAEEIESDLDARLTSSGWGSRARSVVIDPEIEIWVWSSSPHVDDTLGWTGRSPTLREWLVRQGFLQASEDKPARPKEALRAALRESQMRPSAALFAQLAERVGLERCRDRSFRRLRETLSSWFGRAARR